MQCNLFTCFHSLLRFSHSFFHSKDVRLPVQLQRVMAAEAEATREARAKVQSILHYKYFYLSGF